MFGDLLTCFGGVFSLVLTDKGFDVPSNKVKEAKSCGFALVELEAKK